MFGESPVAILLSFENTKYPTMEDKMKTLLRNGEEALAAHELARSHMTDRRKSTFIPFKNDDDELVTHWARANKNKQCGGVSCGLNTETRV